MLNFYSKFNSFKKALPIFGTSLIFMSFMQPLTVQADSVIATEKKLLNGLSAINSLEVDAALQQFKELGESHPKYKLAQLLKADLLAVKSGNLALMQRIHHRNPRTIDKLLSEAEVRWAFSSDSVQVNSGFDQYVIKSAAQKHIIVVNLQDKRLYLYERNLNGQMEKVIDYYVTIGRKGSGKQKEGDLRTPIGIYHMVDLLPGESLPDLYGVGALPLNYPNDWDKKHGKTGSGIWLHGVPSDTYTRAPEASRGCVVLNNDAMEKLLSKYQLPYSTPVIIADEKVPDFAFVESKQTVLQGVQAWLKDNNHSVAWDDVSVYRYPNEQNLFYVTFPNDDEQTLVHQFWERDMQGSWKVVLQGYDKPQPKKSSS